VLVQLHKEVMGKGGGLGGGRCRLGVEESGCELDGSLLRLQNCAANSTGGAVLWVTDGCPSCEANQLNVPASVFLEHFGSSLTLGRVNVSYQQVQPYPLSV